jgi:hypothetical protein
VPRLAGVGELSIRKFKARQAGRTRRDQGADTGPLR